MCWSRDAFYMFAELWLEPLAKMWMNALIPTMQNARLARLEQALVAVAKDVKMLRFEQIIKATHTLNVWIIFLRRLRHTASPPVQMHASRADSDNDETD